MNEKINEFREYRKHMNEKILEKDNLVIKRIFNLDTKTYKEGALSVKTKELIGLTASLVLRCDDCVKYHLEQCAELKISTEEIMEAMSISNLVGGTIVIPHLRHAVEYWEILHE
ncbi:MAG: carboxymuconolactone decarboxylase family protein [Bacteroidota bacterium]|nr:carboxymuconolactone decarboxylase family protein [Bacteroidota bacterium]